MYRISSLITQCTYTKWSYKLKKQELYIYKITLHDSKYAAAHRFPSSWTPLPVHIVYCIVTGHRCLCPRIHISTHTAIRTWTSSTRFVAFRKRKIKNTCRYNYKKSTTCLQRPQLHNLRSNHHHRRVCFLIYTSIFQINVYKFYQYFRIYIRSS